MEGIPAWYWMVMIGVIAALFSLILYHLAMLLRESTGAVSDSRVLIRNSNRIVEEAGEVVSTAKDSVNMFKRSLEEVNESLLAPVKKIGSLLTSVVEFLAELVTPRA